ncbi:MAG: zinc ribbon domain-containing protein [Chloroflexota bacterium]|nr:zinc ribbon domain-containing protein [Chloroflexota bacterium]MDE2959538.1 zinc ribbon domain-containing protein [Chloroflexota bacterium]
MTTSGDSLVCSRCGARHAAEHRFCGSCGAELHPASEAPASAVEIDRLAGARYSPDSGTAPDRAPMAADPAYSAPRDDAFPYYIPPGRIVALTVLSSGLYIFYWMYATWRQYREHTGEIAFPVMHALSLLVPIYQFFRLHAHMRVYQELMEQRGVPTTLSPARIVLIYFGVVLLGLVSFILPAEEPLTMSQQAAYVAINVGQVTLLSWILWHAQTNINRFWQHRLGIRLGWMPLGMAEIVVVAVGLVLGWGMLAIILIDPSLLNVGVEVPAGAGDG